MKQIDEIPAQQENSAPRSKIAFLGDELWERVWKKYYELWDKYSTGNSDAPGGLGPVTTRNPGADTSAIPLILRKAQRKRLASTPPAGPRSAVASRGPKPAVT